MSANRTHLWKAIKPYWRGFLILLVPISLFLTYLAALRPDVTEAVFSRSVYKWLCEVLGRVSGAIPASIAEILLYFLIVTLVVAALVFIFRLIFREQRKQRLLRALANVAGCAGVAVFLFTIFCGLNYHRITFAEQSGLDVHPSSQQELSLLYEELVGEVNALRPLVAEDEMGVMALGQTPATVAERAPAAYAALEQDYPVLGGFTPLPKPVQASRGLSYLDISGIYIPYTFEGNVNIDMPDYAIPFSMMHELAHFKGFMREDEANFIAYLACLETSDIAYLYSGKLLALIYTGNALYAVNPSLYAEIAAELDSRVWLDLQAASAYWSQFEGPLAETSNQINEHYLQANAQADGLRSYGRMVDLLLADYRSRH